MSSNNKVTYCLIFDTNALFQAYEKRADFTTFSFNARVIRSALSILMQGQKFICKIISIVEQMIILRCL